MTSKQRSHACKGIERCSRKLCSCSAPRRQSYWPRSETAIARGDGQALQRAAHSLKGTVRSFGAQAAGEAALRLEVMGRGGDLTQAAPACAELEQEVAHLDTGPGRVPGGAEHVKILIADDDVIPRWFLQTALVKAGHEVVVAHDGAEAWQLLQQAEAPRLAILDWLMPGLDGVDVCRKVRQWDHAPYVYLILLTSKDQQEDIIAGLEAGADDYLTKPFDPQELEARLRTGATHS